MSNRTNSKIPSFLYLFTVGLSLSGYAVDQQCIVRHETCPEHYTHTTFAPTYQEIIKNQPIALAAPIVAPMAVIAIPTLSDDDHDRVENTLDKCPQTPRGYKVDSTGCPRNVTLHMNFPFASNVLPASSIKDVETLTAFLKESPASMVSIIGHTDNHGIDTRNQPRSEARAKALADKLISNGIDANRIKTSGQGSKNPIVSNATDAGRTQNRRIEVQIR